MYNIQVFPKRRKDMEMFHRPLADGVELVSVRTDKFKTGVFSVSLAVPMAAAK